jgi:hypothetical protein
MRFFLCARRHKLWKGMLLSIEMKREVFFVGEGYFELKRTIKFSQFVLAASHHMFFSFNVAR